MAKIISMINQKGGVGKTTTAVNLCACLAVAEKRTLLIDLDPQGNASVALGLDRSEYSRANIYNAVIGDKEFRECIYKSELDYLDVCPSDNNLSGAEVELVSVLARETKLKKAISEVEENYDFIIIDCPPSLGLLTVNSLCASNSFIVPMQTEYLSMEGLAQLLNTVKIIQNSLNPRLVLDGIVLTMFDGRSSLHKQVSKEIRTHFSSKVYQSVIPRSVKLAESPSFGKPIILYDIESKGSQAYLSFAKEIIIQNRTTEKNMNEVYHG